MEEFGLMIVAKQSFLGDRVKVQSTTLVEVGCGAGTCDTPCILGRVLDSAFMQARVRLSCSDSLRDTNETSTCAVPVHAPQTNALW